MWPIETNHDRLVLFIFLIFFFPVIGLRRIWDHRLAFCFGFRGKQLTEKGKRQKIFQL